MPDKWGRIGFEDFYNLSKAASIITGNMQKVKSDKEFKEGSGGKSRSTIEGVEAQYRLAEAKREKNLNDQNELVSTARDNTLLALQQGKNPGDPKTRFEAMGQAAAYQKFREQSDNKQAIDANRQASAGKAWQDLAAGRKLYNIKKQRGDTKGQMDTMVKILNDSNNPYSAKVNPDGTLNVEMLNNDGKYETVDGKMPLGKAEQLLASFNEQTYTRFHIANMEDATQFNFQQMASPQEFSDKNGKKLYVVRQRDPNNANVVKILTYDDKGEVVNPETKKSYRSVEEIVGRGYHPVSKEEKSAIASQAKFIREITKEMAEEDRDFWSDAFKAEYKRLTNPPLNALGDVTDEDFVAKPPEEARKLAKEHADKALAMRNGKGGRKLTDFDRKRLDELDKFGQFGSNPQHSRP